MSTSKLISKSYVQNGSSQSRWVGEWVNLRSSLKINNLWVNSRSPLKINNFCFKLTLHYVIANPKTSRLKLNTVYIVYKSEWFLISYIITPNSKKFKTIVTGLLAAHLIAAQWYDVEVLIQNSNLEAF